jgi:hypothetical protein
LTVLVHRRPTSRRAFEEGFRRTDFGLLGGGVAGFTRFPGAQVQHDLILLTPLSNSASTFVESGS